MNSSPRPTYLCHDIPSPPASPAIKRASITYGRRKEPISDSETSTSIAFAEELSRAGSHKHGILGQKDVTSPNSGGLDAYRSSIRPVGEEEGGDIDVVESSPTNFQFPWKKQLQNIDAIYAKKDASRHGAEGDIVGTDCDVSGASLLHPAAGRDCTPDGSLCAKQPEGSHAVSPADNRTTSFSPSPAFPRQQRSRKVVEDSDEERSDDEISISTADSALSVSAHDSADLSEELSRKKMNRKAVEQLSLDHGHCQAEVDANARKPQRGKQRAKGKERRVKAPTKKEREETHKATARIMADRAISIPRATARQLGLTDLWEKIGWSVRIAQSHPLQQVPTSDPIQPFSSPVVETHAHLPASASPSNAATTSNSHELDSGKEFKPTSLLGLTSVQGRRTVSGDELPSVEELVDEDARERESVKKQEEYRWLAEMRQLVSARNFEGDNELDDLMVIKTRPSMRGAAQRSKTQVETGETSTGKRRQPIFARSLRQPRVQAQASKPGNDNSEFQLLKVSAAPTFARPTNGIKEPVAAYLSKDQLNRILLQKAEQQAEELIRQKEEEWIRRGGKIKVKRADDEEDADSKDAVLSIISKGLSTERIIDENDANEDGDDEDENDGEYVPERGDADNAEGQVEEDGQGDQLSDAETQISVPDDDYETNPAEYAGGGDDDQSDIVYVPRTTRRRRTLAAVHSDDEDANLPAFRNERLLTANGPLKSPFSPTRTALYHRSSISSFEDLTENGTDKENDERLMYDRGEDKENTAVHVHSHLDRRPPISRLGNSFSLTIEDGSPVFDIRTRNSPAEQRRTPLKELPREDDDFDDPFALSSQPHGRGRILIFTPDPSSEYVPQSSPHAVDHERENEVTASPNTTSLAPPAILTTDLSEFFEPEGSHNGPSSTSLMQPKTGEVSQFFTQTTENDGLAQLRRAKPTQKLSLTLEAGIEPTLDVSRSLLRKAGDIFEKEQGLLAEGFGAETGAIPQLYVNEHGFLTQTVTTTKIPASSPLLSPSFLATSSPFAGDSIPPRSATRQPLTPITLKVDLDVADELPRRRLIRREQTPSRHGDPNSTPSKPGKAMNAFELMRIASRSARTQTERTRMLEKSEFIEGEAEESDDDELMGFGRKEDDDDDDENQDQMLPELVDDKAMDEKMLAEKAVLEKVREHQQEDDQALEKIHRDAIEGKYRIKRRDRGIDLEDSESDEDEGDRIRRSKMVKKRKIDGDTLEELGEHPETLAFYHAYKADDINDDDFKYLHADQDEETLVGSQETNSDAMAKQPAINVSELRNRLREAAREEPVEAFDPNDVAWMECDMDEEQEEAVQVKEIPVASKRLLPQQGADWNAGWTRYPNELSKEQLSRLQGWAKGESRTVSTARATRASAVTGPGKRAVGGVSVRGHSHGQYTGAKSSEGNVTRAPKAASALSAVASSRRERFRK